MSKDFIFRGTDKQGEHVAMCITEKELMDIGLIINFRNGYYWIIDIGCRENIEGHSIVFPKGAIMISDSHKDMGKSNTYRYCQFCVYFGSMNDHTDKMIAKIQYYLQEKYKDQYTIKLVDDGSEEYEDMWIDLRDISVADRIKGGEKIEYPF